MKKIEWKKFDFIPYVLMAIFLVLHFVVLMKYGKQVVDSDMSSEMVLASVLNKEGKFITDSWLYYTELRVFNTQLLFKLFLHIFPNDWHLVRTLSQSVLMLLYMLSAIYCVKGIGFEKKGIYIAAILMLPISFWNIFHNYFGGFYLIFAIPTLFLMGLVFRIAKDEKIKIKQIILLIIVSILVGMNGIKVLLYFTIPNIFTSFILLFTLLVKNKIENINIKEKFEYKYFIASLVNAGSMLIGCVIYKFLCKAYNYSFAQEYKWRNLSISELLNSFGNYLMDLGYPNSDYFRANIDVLTFKGIFGVFGVLIILAFIVSIIRLIQRYEKLNIMNKSVFILSLSSILLTIFILTSVYTDTNGSYFIPLIAFAFIIIELEIESEEFSYDWIKNVFRICLIIFVFFASIPNLVWYVEKHPRRDKDIDRAVDYLSENSVDCIYAEFWDANVVTELTNGNIEAIIVNSTKDLSVFDFLQIRDHKNYDNKEVYVLINGIIDLSSDYSKDGIELIYCDEYSIIKAKNKDVYINYFCSVNE